MKFKSKIFIHLQLYILLKLCYLLLLGTSSPVNAVFKTGDITSSTDIMKSIEPTNGISNGKI